MVKVRPRSAASAAGELSQRQRHTVVCGVSNGLRKISGRETTWLGGGVAVGRSCTDAMQTRTPCTWSDTSTLNSASYDRYGLPCSKAEVLRVVVRSASQVCSSSSATRPKACATRTILAICAGLPSGCIEPLQQLSATVVWSRSRIAAAVHHIGCLSRLLRPNLELALPPASVFLTSSLQCPKIHLGAQGPTP